MAITLDEIYELFMWDQSLTTEENEARSILGINEAKKFKYIYPFILPIIPEAGKHIWKPCAKVISSKSNEELKPYLWLLFEWLQDINWPGAVIIYNRLLQMPFTMMEAEYNACRRKALNENDTDWLGTLDDFKNDIPE